MRYRLQTFILVVLLALEIGAGSLEPLASSPGGVMTGSIVESDSGNRRVRKRVEDWRYILDICEEPCLEECKEEIELPRSCCEEVRVSRVGVRVVAMEPIEAIVIYGLEDAECKERE